MTKVILTWQKDDLHDHDWEEEVILGLKKKLSEISMESEGNSEDAYLNCFDLLLRQTVASALEETIQKFALLRSSIRETPQPGWTKLLKYKTIAERLMELSEDALREFQEEQFEKIPYTNQKKLLKELCVLITTLTNSTMEILSQGTFGKFSSVVFALTEEPKDFQDLENQTICNNNELFHLKKDLVMEKKQFRVDMQNAIEEIHRLKNLYEDTVEYSKQQYRYTDDWENAREDQQNLISMQAEDELTNKIKHYKQQMDYESRIHTEVNNYLLENIEDMRNDIQYWMAEYDRHTEQLDTDIYLLKAKWEMLSEDHRSLAILYEEHEVEMREWIQYRDEKKRQLDAAVRIQAWWRGTMVRKKLGPFRVKKKKGKKEKGKGKGGKKGKKR